MGFRYALYRNDHYGKRLDLHFCPKMTVPQGFEPGVLAFLAVFDGSPRSCPWASCVFGRFCKSGCPVAAYFSEIVGIFAKSNIIPI